MPPCSSWRVCTSSRLSVRVKSRKPALRSLRSAAGTSGWGGMVENFSVSSFLSASQSLMPRVSASIFITAPPISVNGTYCPATVKAAEYKIRFENHNRIADLSPKMRSKVGAIVSRLSSVSLTSKTIRGSSDIRQTSVVLRRPIALKGTGVQRTTCCPLLPTFKGCVSRIASCAGPSRICEVPEDNNCSTRLCEAVPQRFSYFGEYERAVLREHSPDNRAAFAAHPFG